MKSKIRYIPLIVVGAIVLSLLAIVPTFGAGDVSFILPGDIGNNNDGTLDDDTPDAQDWARQGGEIGILVTNDDLDVRVKRVLLPMVDGNMEGTARTEAHSAMLTVTLNVATEDDPVGLIEKNDYLMVGDNYVRKVTKVVEIPPDPRDFPDYCEVDSDNELTGSAVSEFEYDGDTEDDNVSLPADIDATEATDCPDNVMVMVEEDSDTDGFIGRTITEDLSMAATMVTVTVDAAFATDDPIMAADDPISVYKINDPDIIGSDDWGDEYASYAPAILMESPSFSNNRYNVEPKVLRNSNIAIGVLDSGDDDFTTVADSLNAEARLGGTGGGGITENDVLVITVTDDAITGRETVDDASPYRVEFNNADANGSYLLGWFDEKNYAQVTVRSQAWQDRETLVLHETDSTSGEFALKIETVEPQETVENDDGGMDTVDVEPTFGVIPTLPVNPTDRVTVSGADSSGSIRVETTVPVFSGLGPAHNASARDDRPDVVAQITDGDSGLDESKIMVLFLIDEDGNESEVTYVPEDDGDVDEISGGFAITQRLKGSDAPDGDATISWWIMATDEAGNVGYSDRQVSKNGEPDPCEPADNAEITDLASAGCQPFVMLVDSTEPVLVRAETGRHWDTSLDTGDSSDKTEYRASKAEIGSVLVVFDEHLDASTVAASDFEVGGRRASGAEVRNVKVRDDSDTGDGNSAIKGDDVQEPGSDFGYVFLTTSGLSPSSQPDVMLVGEVADLAGNRQDTGEDEDTIDRVGPTLTVTIVGGDRPVTDDEIILSITSDENIGAPSIMYYMVTPSQSDDPEAEIADSERGTSAASVVFKSATEYEVTIENVSDDGLYSVYVAADDSSGSNPGTKGDKSGKVDVSSDTSAVLFEWDGNISAPDIDADKDGVQDEFTIDEPNAFIRIDFSTEGNEYGTSKYTVGEGDDATEETASLDLDTHGEVFITYATLDGNDITDDLQPNAGMNVYLYRAMALELGDHDLAITAEDEAGNSNASAFELTITITEREPYELKVNPGWNLVSIPGDPSDTDINVVLGDNPADSVRTYDPMAPGLWLSAARNAEGMFEGTLTDITANRAYWLHTQSFESIDVDIPSLGAGQPVSHRWLTSSRAGT